VLEFIHESSATTGSDDLGKQIERRISLIEESELLTQLQIDKPNLLGTTL